MCGAQSGSKAKDEKDMAQDAADQAARDNAEAQGAMHPSSVSVRRGPLRHSPQGDSRPTCQRACHGVAQ